MAKYALLELNLDDASFSATANAPFSDTDDEETADGEEPNEDGAAAPAGDGDDGPGLVPVLIALVVLFALAALARRQLTDDEPDPIVD
jgi:MYXO-CTERM domain-containing protein